MARVKSVIVWLDVNEMIGIVTPGGMVVLYGDAPTWKYCNAYFRAISEGAAVVAIGAGLDVFTDAANCMVAYSTSEDYAIGKPISQRLGDVVRANAGLPVNDRCSLVAYPKID